MAHSNNPIELPNLSKELILKVLESYDSSLNLVDYKISPMDFVCASWHDAQPPATFSSINLKVKHKNGGDSQVVEELQFTLKEVPVSGSPTHLTSFRKELSLLQKVLSSDDVKNAGDGKPMPVPVLVYSHLDAAYGYIFMEDLLPKKPGNCKLSQDGMDFDHAKLAVQELARFHAVSFLKYRGKGDVILDIYPDFKETLWVAPDQVTADHRKFVEGQVNAIRQHLNEKEEPYNLPRIDHEFGDIFEKMLRQCAPPAENFPSIITLGNCWPNNFLFYYKDGSKKPTHVKFLDFRSAKVASRLCDLSQFLFTSLSFPILSERCYEFQEIYFEAFTNFLVQTHVQSNLSYAEKESLSSDSYHSEFERYRSYGTTIAFIYIPQLLKQTPSSDKPWKSPAARKKWDALMGHIPMCFKPFQPPSS